MSRRPFTGVWVPALTPFRADLSVDRDAFRAHCRWLLEQGADGLAVFGTTSEANSLTLEERMTLLDGLVEAGIPADRLMPGTGCCALPDTVRLTRHAAERGCAGVLVLPPFYYKGVGEDGLFASFSRVIEAVPEDGPGIFLYHIPPMTQVPLSPALIARLCDAYPDRVAGIKDSGGDWSHTRELLERFPGLAVFAGSERFLLDTLRAGGAGCITASGNVNPAGIRRVYDNWRRGHEDADSCQQRATRIRDALEAFAMIPALKTLCARHYGRDEWLNVRPPLMPMPSGQRAALRGSLDRVGFSVGDAGAAGGPAG